MLYRYRAAQDAYTTYWPDPPRDADGSPDPSWYEHCTLDDGYTYVTCNVPVPPQHPLIEWEEVTPPAQLMGKVRAASAHVALMEQRVAAGKYMREDKHIVPGDAQQVSAWRQSVLAMFGLGAA